MVLYKTVFSAYFSRFATVLCKFIMVPILVRSLLPKDYAAFIIIGALEGWFLLLDFGVGSSLQNYLTEARAKGESEKPFLKTALIMGLVSLGLGLIFLSCGYVFLSAFLFGSILSLKQANSIFFLSGLILLLGTFGSLAGRIFMARKKGHIFYLLQGFSSFLSLIFLGIAAYFNKLSLVNAVMICLGIPCFFAFLQAVFLFYRVEWKAPLQRDLLSRAKRFWIFSCMAAFVTLSDTLIGAQTLQIEELIEYNLLCKIFGVASFAYSAFLQALMPECTEGFALAQGALVRRKIRYGIFFSVVGVLLFTTTLSISTDLVEKIFRIPLSKIGIALFAFYLIIRIVSDFYAMALQSASVLRPFFYLLPVQAVLSVTLQYSFSSFLGLSGLLIALSLSYLLTVFWALPRQLNAVGVS